MTTRRTSQALSLALAGMVTLAVLGSVDFLATQPQQEALLARTTPATTPATTVGSTAATHQAPDDASS